MPANRGERKASEQKDQCHVPNDIAKLLRWPLQCFHPHSGASRKTTGGQTSFHRFAPENTDEEPLTDVQHPWRSFRGYQQKRSMCQSIAGRRPSACAHSTGLSNWAVESCRWGRPRISPHPTDLAPLHLPRTSEPNEVATPAMFFRSFVRSFLPYLFFLSMGQPMDPNKNATVQSRFWSVAS